MNKYNTLRWALATTLLSLMIGCTPPAGTTQKEKNMVVDSVVIHRTEHMMNDSTKPKCTTDLILHYPKTIDGVKDLTPILNQLVVEILGEEYAQVPLADAAKTYVDKYIQEYQGMGKEYQEFVKLFDEESSIPTFTFEHTITSKITYCGGNLLSIQVYNYSFTGGAHGNYGYFNYSWDLTTNRLIKQEDLFVENSADDINRIIRETLMKEYDIPAGEKLEENGFFSDNEISANNNILLDNTSITWIYSPYEIAPYSTGSPEVTIPYSDLTLFLKEENPISAFIKK